MKHQTYIINLEKRKERKNHSIEVFDNRKEFEVTIFNAIEHKSGTMGLFLSFQKIVTEARDKNFPYVIVCEDDHIFTPHYDKAHLNNLIKLGLKNNFDMLTGGPSNIHDVLFYNDNIVWLGGFTGLQFTIVFQSYYEKIISFNFPDNGTAFDLLLAKSSDNIFACYPPISEQRYFGYSDATSNNNKIDVEIYFDKCRSKLDRLYKVYQYYNQIRASV